MAEEMATGTREWAGLWLSEERLVPYLEACGGDADRAVELHEWNISLAQVLMRDVAHLEVAMRNAYDRALSDAWGGGAHWLLDDGSPVRRPLMRKAARGELDLNRINRKIIDAAVEKLPAGFTTGQLVSNLTLGFWVHLADRSREAAIWRTALYRAWPRGTSGLATLMWTVPGGAQETGGPYMRDPRHPRHFTDEFKRQIVDLYNAGKPKREIMDEYDLGKSTVERWIKSINATGSPRAACNRTPEQNRILELERENRRLRMEVDVLKQAALIYARK